MHAHLLRARYTDIPSDLPVRGAAGLPRVFRSGWEAPAENPFIAFGTQRIIGNGVSFLWILFFRLQRCRR
ncbi:hypothetical protein MKFW12EY_06890 [Methylomonas koyamae]|nr:hypothetical protein MKFW12EY_06890 [Methylomonas koyamae]